LLLLFLLRKFEEILPLIDLTQISFSVFRPINFVQLKEIKILPVHPAFSLLLYPTKLIFNHCFHLLIDLLDTNI